MIVRLVVLLGFVFVFDNLYASHLGNGDFRMMNGIPSLSDGLQVVDGLREKIVLIVEEVNEQEESVSLLIDLRNQIVDATQVWQEQGCPALRPQPQPSQGNDGGIGHLRRMLIWFRRIGCVSVQEQKAIERDVEFALERIDITARNQARIHDGLNEIMQYQDRQQEEIKAMEERSAQQKQLQQQQQAKLKELQDRIVAQQGQISRMYRLANGLVAAVLFGVVAYKSGIFETLYNRLQERIS